MVWQTKCTDEQRKFQAQIDTDLAYNTPLNGDPVDKGQNLRKFQAQIDTALAYNTPLNGDPVDKGQNFKTDKEQASKLIKNKQLKKFSGSSSKPFKTGSMKIMKKYGNYSMTNVNIFIKWQNEANSSKMELRYKCIRSQVQVAVCNQNVVQQYAYSNNAKEFFNSPKINSKRIPVLDANGTALLKDS